MILPSFRFLRNSGFSKLTSRTILLLAPLLIVSGCSGSGDNPLIGSWKFSGTTGQMSAQVCYATMTFTETGSRNGKATFSSPPSGGLVPPTTTMNVIYVPAPTLVTVMAGNNVNYTFTDKNHTYTDSAWGKCLYERT